MFTPFAPRKANVRPRMFLPINTASMKRQNFIPAAPAAIPASSNTGIGIAESTTSVMNP